MKKRIIGLLLACACPVWAQNDIQAAVNLQFRFVNPGARAQAMGGAFIGLADDTTAIFSNPAGLTQISKSTLALELNSTRRQNNIPFYSGRIEQTGLQDFTFDLEGRDFPERDTTVPFLGYVRTSGKIEWGLFYAEQANFQRQFDTLGLAIPAFAGGRYVSQNRLEIFVPSENSLELTLRSVGASIAGKFSDHLAGGLTLGYNQMRYRANSTLLVPDPRLLFPEINFSPSDLAGIIPFIGQVFAQADADGDDEQLSVFAGLLYTPSDTFAVGLAYKHQPTYDYDYLIQGRDDNFQPVDPLAGAARFNVPDSYGVGFSFKPSDVMILSAELNAVQYSDLVDDFFAFFANENDPSGNTQTVDDTVEYHIGFEYVVTSFTYPLAIRGGYWFEPYHALLNTALDTQLLFRYIDNFGDYVQGTRPTVFLQQFEEDLNHITFGLGLSFGTSLTLDLSGDVDENDSSFSLSGIYRF